MLQATSFTPILNPGRDGWGFLRQYVILNILVLALQMAIF
jgi:hypothetical protein